MKIIDVARPRAPGVGHRIVGSLPQVQFLMGIGIDHHQVVVGARIRQCPEGDREFDIVAAIVK